MKNNTIPDARSGNDKYGLGEIKFGEYKDFDPDIYNTVRLSAWYHAKKLRARFVTRKLKNEKGKFVIRVYRD